MYVPGGLLAKTQIVWFQHCDLATCFNKEAKATAAAVKRSQEKNYGHEAFHCDKEHLTKSGVPFSNGCWHVRGRVRPIPKGFEGVRLT